MAGDSFEVSLSLFQNSIHEIYKICNLTSFKMDRVDSEAMVSFSPSPIPRTVQIPQELFECPVCASVPKENLNIFQCAYGHIICESCYKRLTVKECPSCRTSIANVIRNLHLEKISQYIIEPCPNAKNGCDDFMQRLELQVHLKQCRFRPQHFCKTIGYTDCSYDVLLANPRRVVDHLTTTHLRDMNSVVHRKELSFEFDCTAKLCEEGNTIRLFRGMSCQKTSTFFLLIMKPDLNSDAESEGILVQCLCICESECDAAKYRATFYFTSANEQKCVASWPTPWYKKCISRECDIECPTSHTSSHSTKYFWSGAYHISKRTLAAIQGEDSSMRLLVRIKGKDEL